MTAMIISNTAPFGALTNDVVAELFDLNEKITRLQAAISNAASGYTGIAGTEYEGNNFGVVSEPKPGVQGSAYAVAAGTIINAWQTFWVVAVSAIEALDNGVIK